MQNMKHSFNDIVNIFLNAYALDSIVQINRKQKSTFFKLFQVFVKIVLCIINYINK